MSFTSLNKPEKGSSGTYVPTPSQQEKINADLERSRRAEESYKAQVDNLKTREDVQYTLFASGIRHGRGSELEDKNTSDNIAILFDSVNNHTITRSYNKTSYAVESKAKASDHVVTQDGKFSFSGIITDSPYTVDSRNFIDLDTDPDRPMDAKRPAKALEILRAIADAHQLVTLVTEDDILTGYVITNLTFDRNSENGASLGVSLDLEEFRFKHISKTILARGSDPKKAGNANKGAKQTADDGKVSDDAQGKRPSPYLGKNKEKLHEAWERQMAGTEDFGGKAGTKLSPTEKFDPASLARK